MRARRVRIRPLNLMAGERIASLAMSPNGRVGADHDGRFPTTARSRRAFRTTSPRAATPKTSTAARRSATIRTAAASRSCRCRRATVHFLRVGDDGVAPSAAQVLGWNEDGSRALLFSTSTDFKDRWIHTVTGDSGTLKLVDTLHDSAWVAGPCFGCGGWYDGGSASTSSPKRTATRISTRWRPTAATRSSSRRASGK